MSWMDAVNAAINTARNGGSRQNVQQAARDSFTPKPLQKAWQNIFAAANNNNGTSRPTSADVGLQGPSYTQNGPSADKSDLPHAEAPKPDTSKKNEDEEETVEYTPKKEKVSHAGDAAVEYGGLLGAIPVVGPVAGMLTQMGGAMANAADSDYADLPYERTAEQYANNQDFLADPNALSMPDAQDVSNMSDAHREQWLHDNGIIMGDFLLNSMLPGGLGTGVKNASKAAKTLFERTAKGLADEAAEYADNVAQATGKQVAAKQEAQVAETAAKEATDAARKEAEKTAKMESEILGREVTAEEVLARNTAPKAAEEAAEETAEEAAKSVPESQMLKDNKASIDKSIEYWRNPETKSKYLETVSRELEKYPPEIQDFIKNDIAYATKPAQYWGARAAEPNLSAIRPFQDALWMNAGKQMAGRGVDLLGQPLLNDLLDEQLKAPEGETGNIVPNPYGDGSDVAASANGSTGDLADEESKSPIADGDDPNKLYYGKTASELMKMYEDQIYDAAMADRAYRQKFNDAGYGDQYGSYAAFGNLGDTMDYSSRRNVTRDIFGLNEGENPLEIQGLKQIYKENGIINDNMSKEEQLEAILNAHWGAENIIDPYMWLDDANYEAAHMLNGDTAAEKYAQYWLDNNYMPLPDGLGSWDNALSASGLGALDSRDVAAMINTGNLVNQIRSGVIFDPALISEGLRRPGDKIDMGWLPLGEDQTEMYSNWTKNKNNRDYSAAAIGQALVNTMDPNLQLGGQNINVYEPYGIDADMADFIAAEMEAKDRQGRKLGRRTKND